MRKCTVPDLTRVLRALVLGVLVLNVFCLLLVPGFAALLVDGG